MFQKETLIVLLQGVFYAMLIGAMGYIIANIVSQLTKKGMTRFIDPAWSNFVASLIQLAVFLIAGQLILQVTGLAGLFVIIATTLTAAMAVASEQMISDVVAGVMLILFRYYKIGDRVKIGGEEGEVLEITLSSTILNADGRNTIMVANSQILDDIIVNHTAIIGQIVRAEVSVPLSVEIEPVMELLLGAIEKFSPMVTEKGCEPKVLLSDIRLNSYFLTLKIYVPDELDAAEVIDTLGLLALQVLVEQEITFAQDNERFREIKLAQLKQLFLQWQQNIRNPQYETTNILLFIELINQGIIPNPPQAVYFGTREKRVAYMELELIKVFDQQANRVLAILEKMFNTLQV